MEHKIKNSSCPNPWIYSASIRLEANNFHSFLSIIEVSIKMKKWISKEYNLKRCWHNELCSINKTFGRPRQFGIYARTSSFVNKIERIINGFFLHTITVVEMTLLKKDKREKKLGIHFNHKSISAAIEFLFFRFVCLEKKIQRNFSDST